MEYIFDTHAHYDDEAFDEDRESLIGSLREKGIGNVCNIGASMESCRTTLALAEKYPFFYGALGVHPNETKDLTEEDMDWLRKASGSEKIVAIGHGASCGDPQPGRGKGHHGHYKSGAQRDHRRRDPLLFLRRGPGPGISGHGIFLRDRRCPDL